jgi:HK97 family phage portal protein
MTHFIFIKTLMAHVLLWGNGYAEIERNGAGQAIGLWPRSPQRTRPRRVTADSKLIYTTSDGIWEPWQSADQSTAVPERTILPENILSVPGLSLDGRIGQNTVELARQLVGLALASDKYGAKFFGNGAIPTGIITNPNYWKGNAREEARKSWQEAFGGENTFRTAFLEGGIDYKKIGSTPAEASMVDVHKWHKTQVASIFHVPPTMLGLPGANRASAEQVALEFVNYTLGPWVKVWQEELTKKLLPPVKFGRNAGKKFGVMLDTRRLTLPDARAKQAFYSTGRQWGFLNANDIRDFEDLNPIEGGDAEEYWTPVNMAEGAIEAAEGGAGKGLPVTAAATGAAEPHGDGKDKKKADEDARAKFNSAIWPLFRDAFGRAITRKERDYRTIERIFTPIIQAINSLAGRSGVSLRADLETLADHAPAWKSETLEVQARAELEMFLERRGVALKGFYLARHGETDNDSEGASDDFHPEEPLNASGKAQARALSEYVNAHLAIARVICPTPNRHTETAESVSGNFLLDSGLEPQKDSESDAEFHSRIVGAIERIRTAPENAGALVITSHKGIKAYLKAIRGDDSAKGGEHVGFCALYEVAPDGKDAHLIFDPMG